MTLLWEGGNVIGNSRFGLQSYRLNNNIRAASDGIYKGYYMIMFYGTYNRPKSPVVEMGSLIFRKKETYNSFIEHYEKYYKHFRNIILKNKK